MSFAVWCGDSWQTGMAFVALVHAINPNAIDFDSRNKVVSQRELRSILSCHVIVGICCMCED